MPNGSVVPGLSPNMTPIHPNKKQDQEPGSISIGKYFDSELKEE